ncbi:MAG: MBL fold metallo-hydrolase, partial [Aeromicrobium sp.]
DHLPEEIVGQVPMDLLGLLTGLPAGTEQIPWEGPDVRIIEHQAHAPGHAALLIQERGVLVVGDMLSDVLVPMLDFRGATDPIGDYLTALELIEAVVGDVDVAVPGHGTIAAAGEIQERVDLDRAYVIALRDGQDLSDPRIGSSAQPGWEWVSSIHEGQLQSIAQRNEGEVAPDQPS